MTREEALDRFVELRGQKLYWKVSGRPVKCCDDGRGYRKFCVNRAGRFSYGYKEHRVLWYFHHGEWPKQTIDHINRDPTDNRIENLRDVSQRENNLNSRAYDRRGRTIARHVKTVCGWVVRSSSNRWTAFVKPKGVRVYLGCFASIEEANAAREGAARLLEALRDPAFATVEEPALTRPGSHSRRPTP